MDIHAFQESSEQQQQQQEQQEQQQQQQQDDGLQIVQERVLNRTPEQIVGVPVPQTTEAPVDVVPSPPQEREQNRVAEQIVGIPVPQLMEAVVEVIPKERFGWSMSSSCSSSTV